jgi:F-type H+-transporting ATPase subunit b
MRKHLIKTLCGIIIVTLLWDTATLWGAEEHGEDGLHISGIVFATVNFLLFVYLLRRFALGWARDTVRQRHNTIVQTLDEARQAKEEAEALKQEYEQKLKGMAEEEEKIRAQVFEIAEKESARMREEAQRMAERIREEARRSAEREVEEARQTLRQEVAQLAVETAVRLVQEQLTQADHHRLVQDFVTGMRPLANTSSRQ